MSKESETHLQVWPEGPFCFYGARLVLEERVREGWLRVEGGRFAAVGEGEPAPAPGDEVVNLEGLTLWPGLIDVHVHGGDGSDTMDATPEALRRMARIYARFGTTRFLATTMAADREDLLAVARAVAVVMRAEAGEAEDGGEAQTAGGTAAKEGAKGAGLLGLHLEGPFLNPEYRGAQGASRIRSLTEAELEEIKGLLPPRGLRMVTLAPEAPGALALIPSLVKDGVVVSAGHTGATYEEMKAAVAAGLRHATHTANGMRGLHHREPGALGAILDLPEVTAQVIADGIHLHPAMLRLILAAKGVDGVVLITDGVRALGLADGRYEMGGEEIIVRGREARRPDGTLCGSRLTMWEAVQNMQKYTGVSLPEAVRMGSLNPARALGIDAAYGSLAAGKVADFVVLTPTGEVAATFVAGRRVW